MFERITVSKDRKLIFAIPFSGSDKKMGILLKLLKNKFPIKQGWKIDHYTVDY